MTFRENTRKVNIGGVVIGGGSPIAVQSMTNTKTQDVDSTVAQIHELEEAGCDIVRCTVPDEAAARALKEIKKEVKKLPYVKRKNSKIFQKNQPKISPSNEFNSQNGLFYYLELDLNDPAYTEEINKIKSYKNHCIYNSIDELKMNIFYYKRQLSDIKKYLKKQEDIDENSLRVRENDFNNLKEIFKNTMQLQQKYKNNNSVQDNNSDIYHYYCLSKKDVNFTILNKIAILNDTCKLLGLKYKPEFLGEKKLKKKFSQKI